MLLVRNLLNNLKADDQEYYRKTDRQKHPTPQHERDPWFQRRLACVVGFVVNIDLCRRQ
jgi:hypothetical protein